MKEIKLYQCGICYTQYADRNECKRCEAAHKQNLELKEASYKPYTVDHSGFPIRITVMDSKTGETAVYKR